MMKPGYFWKKGLWTLMSLSFLGIIVCCLLYLYLELQLPDVETLKQVQFQVPLRIFSQDGKLIAEYGEKRRIPVKYQDIPQPLIQAILATEDQRFFEHPGVDIFGLGRAALQVIKTGAKSQGGSTITMQVARNFFLSRKKTYLRKFNEILLAIKIDKELSKEKILELYFNKIYLGNRAYGVGAAAKVYYGKKLSELSLAQLTMIAGLPQAPSSQNPLANPKGALKRRNHVLSRLYEENYLSKAQYEQALSEPLTAQYHGQTIEVQAPYVAEMIRQALFKHFGEATYTKGYKVTTTIKSHLQLAANQAVEDNLIAYDQRHGFRGPVAHINLAASKTSEQWQAQLKPYSPVNDLIPAIVLDVDDKEAIALIRSGETVTIPWKGMKWAKPALKHGWVGKAPSFAHQILKPGDIVYVRHQKAWQLSQLPLAEAALIALNPKDGAILSLTGGFNFYRSKYNRVTQSTRQPGSSFKPFIYAAALEKGYSLSTLINDAPIVIDDPSQESLWRPQNSSKKFYGPTRLRVGLIKSRNLVSIRILEEIGIDYAIDYLTKFGFKREELPKTLSLALGSLGVSPLELATAYAILANGGYKIEPYLIEKIEQSDGNVLLQANPIIACSEHCEHLPASQLAPQVISAQVAYLMSSVLQDVIQHGTGRGAKVLKRNDLAGKTGTTNEQVDAWFTGYNQHIVTAAWVGFDTPRSLHEYAAQAALPLWIDFMRVALTGIPNSSLARPDDIISVKIDPETGLLANSHQANGMFELFRKHNIPQQTAIKKIMDSEKKSVQDLF